MSDKLNFGQENTYSCEGCAYLFEPPWVWLDVDNNELIVTGSELFK